MIDKMANEASAILLLICLHEVWIIVAYDGPRPCAYACVYVDPVFTNQSYDLSISISISTRRTNLSVFLVLMLMSTQFSLVSTCACAYAYAYALVKTWLYKRSGPILRLAFTKNVHPRAFVCIINERQKAN